MKKIHLLIATIICSLYSHAQIDTSAMRQYILTHQSKTEQIEKCRNRILESIINNNRENAEELMYYAKTNLETDKYKSLTLDEIWLLAIWLRKYQLATSEMILDSITIASFKNQVNRHQYNLTTILSDSLYINNNFYKNDITTDASLNGCQRDFLLLFLKEFEPLPHHKATNIINDACDKYLINHPMSEYETFVRNIIRQKYNEYGPTFEFGINVGMNFNTKEFSDLLKNSLFGGMHIRLIYLNMLANATFVTFGGRLKEDLDFGNVILEEGEKSVNFHTSFSVGYKINIPYNISISPMLGFSYFRIMPNSEIEEKKEEFKNAGIAAKWKPIFTVELSYENAITQFYQKPNGHISKFYCCPIIRYSYQPIEIESKTLTCSGSMHIITLGLKYGFEKIVRDF